MVISVDYKSGCLVCGKELVYQKKFENVVCYYCNETYDSNVKCVDGHFICDRCHRLSANELIEEYCIKTESEDPLELAITLMRNPNLKMHGPEHHFLVPAVLLASYYNMKKDRKKKETKIKEARRRAEKILGGFCGSHGDCGAAVGTGIFVSLITGATPLSNHEWRLSNTITAKSLLSIANHGGPRCCKRNTYLAIIEAVTFLKEGLKTTMRIDEDMKCEFNPLNKECIKGRCPFYGGSRNDH